MVKNLSEDKLIDAIKMMFKYCGGTCDDPNNNYAWWYIETNGEYNLLGTVDNLLNNDIQYNVICQKIMHKLSWRWDSSVSCIRGTWTVKIYNSEYSSDNFNDAFTHAFLKHMN